MRIGERDLEPDVKQKLNQLENLKASFNKSNQDGFVAYNGSEFYIKTTNNTFLRKALSEEDIYSFRKHRYVEDHLHTNSFMSDFNHKDSSNAALISHVWDVNDKPVINLSEDIHIMKELNNNYYIFDVSGTLSKIRDGQLLYQINILELIRKTFSLNNFLIFDILTIEPILDALYICTSNGVYKYNEQSRDIELAFKESNVINIAVLDNNEVFLSTRKGCYIYSSETGLKLETHNQLKNNLQIPIETIRHGDYVFLVSKSLGVNNGDKALHCWKKDPAGLSYNNIDSVIRANSDDNEYHVKRIFVTDTDVYVGGVKNNHFFIWKYDINYLYKPYEEIIFNKFEIDDISDFAIIGKKTIVATGSRLYIFNDDMRLLYNFNLKRHIYAFTFANDKFHVAAGHAYIEFDLPEFERKEETVALKIYDDEPCNNIDVYVDGLRENRETVEFFDESTMREIRPVFYVYDHDQLIVKFMNSNCNKILMRLGLKEDSIVRSIVVKRNAIFLI